MRECSKCGKKMEEGYCKGDGEEYVCSDECLFTDGYTPKERDEDYEDGYIYWTQWDDIDAREAYNGQNYDECRGY